MKTKPLWLVVAILIVGGFEGLRTKAYPDVIGIPTICYGETSGVHLGDTKTKAECDEMLSARLAEFDNELSHCLPESYKSIDGVRISLISLAYNVGSSAVCESSIKHHLYDKDFDSVCESILSFNKVCVKRNANGKCLEKKVIKGLDLRRKQESEICKKSILNK